MRELEQLNIREVKHLCHHLHCDERELACLRSRVERHYRRGSVNRNGKVRPTAEPIGRFREIIDCLCRLLQRVQLPAEIHGGVKGRSPVTNATPHVRKPAVLRFDLQDFFPHVKPRMVYNTFVRLGCSPDVARILTRLATLDGGLPQGSPTSTVVANLVIAPLAGRLARLADTHRSDYTQYVDDGTFSGPAYLENLRPLIDRIIRQSGLTASPKPEKRTIKYAHEEQTVTGVKVNNGIDVPKEKVRSVRSSIDALTEEMKLGQTPSPKQLASLSGKIGHIRDLNRGAARLLSRRTARLAGNAQLK